MAEKGLALTARTLGIVAEIKMQSAIEAGEFENLPGLGGPLPDLGSLSDSNWWLFKTIRCEKLAELKPGGGLPRLG